MIFIGVLIGFIGGWIMLRMLINHRMKIMLESIANTPVPKKEIAVMDINLIKIKDRVYAYNRKDKSFLGYGDTKAEIVDSLRKRYPRTSFMANHSNIKEVEFDDTI